MQLLPKCNVLTSLSNFSFPFPFVIALYEKEISRSLCFQFQTSSCESQKFQRTEFFSGDFNLMHHFTLWHHFSSHWKSFFFFISLIFYVMTIKAFSYFARVKFTPKWIRYWLHIIKITLPKYFRGIELNFLYSFYVIPLRFDKVMCLASCLEENVSISFR